MAEQRITLHKWPDPDRLPADYVCLDLETTGLDPFRGAEIIEAAAVRVEGFAVKEEFSETVRPEGPVPPDVTRLTGISSETLRFSLPAGKVIPGFLAFVGDLPVIGHNVTFDLRFLSYYSRLVSGRDLPNPYLDTMQLSRRVFTKKKYGRLSHSLEALCGRLGVENRNAHRALGDVYAAHGCYLALFEMINEECFTEDMNESPDT
ncbi:MAG: 3'-5' exonuclease [Abditibacteriota bacterium]|nr:3'-5' exonuclease [Abditibacteriota bacterium]